jgi:hypothetical protein
MKEYQPPATTAQCFPQKTIALIIPGPLSSAHPCYYPLHYIRPELVLVVRILSFLFFAGEWIMIILIGSKDRCKFSMKLPTFSN